MSRTNSSSNLFLDPRIPVQGCEHLQIVTPVTLSKYVNAGNLYDERNFADSSIIFWSAVAGKTSVPG